jgi:hypothetical protein
MPDMPGHAGRPEPTPWGAAIAAACRQAGLSARAAARAAGLSEGRWRQITSGYQVVGPGVYAPVHGPAATVARMAAVAGLAPDDLRAAGREDAARLLASRDGPGWNDSGWNDSGWDAADQLVRRIRSMDAGQARDLLAQIAATLAAAVSD